MYAQPETERRLAEIGALTRAAWSAYRQDLDGLSGHMYELAETAAWDRLRASLVELEAERTALSPDVVAR